jgi:hypothetical protein
LDNDLGRKWKPKYLGPFVMVRRSKGGAYKLAELDGSVSKLKYAAKRVIPYYLRTTWTLPIPRKMLAEVQREEEADKS